MKMSDCWKMLFIFFTLPVYYCDIILHCNFDPIITTTVALICRSEICQNLYGLQPYNNNILQLLVKVRKFYNTQTNIIVGIETMV